MKNVNKEDVMSKAMMAYVAKDHCRLQLAE